VVKDNLLPADMMVVGGQLYFFDVNSYQALWKCDGTAAGTVLVADVPAGTQLRQLAAVGNQVFFTSEDLGSGAGYERLWRTDGTGTGAVLLHSWQKGMDVETSGPDNLVAMNGNLYFRVDDGATNTDGLWKSDGTAAGTVPVFTLPAQYRSFISHLTAMGNELYFIGIGPSGFPWTALWKSDGTTVGTSVVAPGETISPVASLLTAYGAIFFTGEQNSVGKLWQTDGTDAGTVALADTGGAGVYDLGAVNGSILFDAFDGAHGVEPWAVPADYAPATIAGSIFDDANHNGARDPGEGGLAGITVFLDLNGDGRLDAADPTTRTDAGGTYTFTGLPPGTYTIRQVVPSGYAATAPLGYSGTVTVSSGQLVAGPDFGNVQTSTVPLDFTYLVTLARNYSRPGTFATGDLNGDGVVDFDDLVILARSYGHRPSSGSIATTANSLLPAFRKAAHRR